MSRARFNVAFHIDAPPERVFAVLCDVERWPEWTSSMTRVQRLDRGTFGIGAKARVIQPKLRAATWQVTELQENRSFTWVAQSPGVRIKAGHFVEAEGGGSRGSLSLEFGGFLGPIAARLYRRLIEQYMNTEAQGLKRRSEDRSAVPQAAP
jgi:uncharacterized protein YndB with AHSA1/START domain